MSLELVVVETATVSCPHSGTGSVVSAGQTKVKAAGNFVAVVGGSGIIAGCTLPSPDTAFTILVTDVSATKTKINSLLVARSIDQFTSNQGNPITVVDPKNAKVKAR